MCSTSSLVDQELGGGAEPNWNSNIVIYTQKAHEDSLIMCIFTCFFHVQPFNPLLPVIPPPWRRRPPTFHRNRLCRGGRHIFGSRANWDKAPASFRLTGPKSSWGAASVSGA